MQPLFKCAFINDIGCAYECIHVKFSAHSNANHKCSYSIVKHKYLHSNAKQMRIKYWHVANIIVSRPASANAIFDYLCILKRAFETKYHGCNLYIII